ncbi:hypothetical protein Leryth_008006 [Lithospermum erythrorhizon]|nr:hypothetical protein Leryth_008006 [Lithospermum erythrorhizon]
MSMMVVAHHPLINPNKTGPLPSITSSFVHCHNKISVHLSTKAPALSVSLRNISKGKVTIHQTMAGMGVKSEASPNKVAVVTGANKGIGLETVRELTKAGATVILTARNEKRGMEATSLMHNEGLSNVLFHQLDVQDDKSIVSLAEFVKAQFGRLDILVNNAASTGVVVDEDCLRAKNIDPADWLSDVMITTYDKAKECLETNYFGVKKIIEALLPLLQLSSSPRIVNLSTIRSQLRRVPDEQRRKVLGDIDNLTEEAIEDILQTFMSDVKEDKLEENGWQKMLPAYSISKVSLNAYTRILAKKYPNMLINCVHPGYVNTDANWHTGTLTLEEGAQGPVMVALLPDDGPTGCYFDRTQLADF